MVFCVSFSFNNSNNLLSEITPATISFIVCLYNSNEESEHFTSTSDGSCIFFCLLHVTKMRVFKPLSRFPHK